MELYSKICAFTQFQAQDCSGSQKNGRLLVSYERIQVTVPIPNKENTEIRVQNEKMLVSECQLIANYPQSQEHTQTNGVEQNIIEPANGEEESLPQCSDCIDIDSIMNPTNTDKADPYNINNSEVEPKGANMIGQTEMEKPQFKERDETKNIPKNYIKAIFSFVLENPALVKKMLSKKRIELASCEINMFVEYVRVERKNRTYTIGRLKQIWLGESYGKIMRILYAYFLRKRSLHYIYSSKIENKASHAKYRQKLLDSLEDPTGFNSFK